MPELIYRPVDPVEAAKYDRRWQDAPIPASTLQLLEWFEEYLAGVGKHASSTIYNYMSALKAAFKPFLSRPITHVKDDELLRALRSYRESRAPGRVVQLNAAYSALETWIQVTFPIRMPLASRRREDQTTRSGSQTALVAVPDGVFDAIKAILDYAGRRLSQTWLLGLTRNQIRIDRNGAKIPTATRGKSVSIPRSGEAFTAVERVLLFSVAQGAPQAPDGPFLARTPGSPEPMSVVTLRSGLRAARERARARRGRGDHRTDRAETRWREERPIPTEPGVRADAPEGSAFPPWPSPPGSTSSGGDDAEG